MKLADAFVEMQLRGGLFRSQLAGQLSQVQQYTQRMQQSGSGLGKLFGSAAAMGGGMLLAGGLLEAKNQIEGMVHQGIAFNAQMETSMASMEVLTGSARRARNLMADMQKFAADTPFEMPTLTKAATSLLATKKVAHDEVIPMMKKLGDAAAGSSQGFASMPRITLAVSQMFSKGKVTGEEMMQLAEAGVPAWQALATKMKKSTAEVQEMSQKGQLGIKHVKMLVDGLGDTYKGLAAKQARTFEGLKSTISDNFSMAMGQIFKPVFELVKEVMEKIVDGVSDKRITLWTVRLADGVAVAVRWIRVATAWIVKFAQSPMAAMLAKVAAVSAGFFAIMAVLPLIGATIGAVFSSVPFVALMGVLTVVVDLFKEAFTGSGSGAFLQTIKECWGLIKEIGQNIYEAVLPAMQSLGNLMASVFGSGGTAQSGFNAFVGTFLGWAKQTLEWISLFTNNFGMAWEAIKLGAAIVVSMFSDKFSHFLNEVMPFWINGVIDGFMNGGKELVSGWMGLFQALVESIGIMFNGIVDSQKARVEALAEAAKKILKGDISGGLSDMAGGAAKSEEIRAKAEIEALKNYGSAWAGLVKKVSDATAKGFRDNASAAPEAKESAATKLLKEELGKLTEKMKASQEAKRNERFSVGDAMGRIGGELTQRFGDLSKILPASVVGGVQSTDVYKGVTGWGEQMLKYLDPAAVDDTKAKKAEHSGFAEYHKKVQASLAKSKEDIKDEKKTKLMEDANKKAEEIKVAVMSSGTQLVSAFKGWIPKFGK